MRARTLLALAVLLLAGAGRARAGDLDALVARLAAPDGAQSYQAYRALLGTKDPALAPLLVKALPGASELGQYYGVLLLQRLPARAATPALRHLAADSSPHLRVVALVALQRAGARDVGPDLARALRTKGVAPAARATLLMRVTSVRDPDVQEAVRGFLASGQAPEVIEAATYDVYLVRDAQAVAPLRALLAHDDVGVRAVAAGCLLVLGQVSAADALAAAIAAGGIPGGPLYKVKTFLDQARPAPVAVLEAIRARLPEETDAFALRVLVQILGDHAYGRAAPDLRRLLDHRDAQVSKAAFEALSRIPGGVTADAMRRLLQSGDDARRLAAADALRRADDLSGFPAVVSILASGTKLTDRAEAARVLGGFRSARAVPPLLDALGDASSAVRANALNSLGTVLRTIFPYRRLDLGRTGYSASGPADRRAAGLQAIRAWWKAHASSDW
jgi:HEAT repeat protein